MILLPHPWTIQMVHYSIFYAQLSQFVQATINAGISPKQIKIYQCDQSYTIGFLQVWNGRTPEFKEIEDLFD